GIFIFSIKTRLISRGVVQDDRRRRGPKALERSLRSSRHYRWRRSSSDRGSFGCSGERRAKPIAIDWAPRGNCLRVLQRLRGMITLIADRMLKPEGEASPALAAASGSARPRAVRWQQVTQADARRGNQRYGADGVTACTYKR